jgi:hypothetical protein
VGAPSPPTDGNLVWGKKVSPEFKAKVIQIAGRLGMDPNHIMAVMMAESGLNPKAANGKTAVGLIQFTDKGATAVGTTKDAIAAMDGIQQLDYVEKYFQDQMFLKKDGSTRLTDIGDVYAAVACPAAVGKPDDYVLYSTPSKAYLQNQGLDLNKDGSVTKGELAQRAMDRLLKGRQDEG